MTIYAYTIAGLKLLVHDLSGIVAKGEQSHVLMSSRLAPDMYDLGQQISLCCNHIVETAARLSHTEPLTIGQVENYASARQAIERTLSYIESTEAVLTDASFDRIVQIPVKGKDDVVFQMSEAESVRDWHMPQIYFHMVTAYCILRANGVALGVQDYMSHMGSKMGPKK